jgi:sigma-B regulation protein RsbU (phosphoserine phosphatase)
MFTAKEVGGDFYDFYFVDEDTLAFLVADVSGKGIPAAMFMMQSKTLLKSCAESGMAIETVFTTANEKLCEGNEAGMFVTAWMGLLNVKTGLVTFANAGHNPPLVRQEGEFRYHKTRAGFVLAGMEGIRYRRFDIQLAPGDTIFLYTDGVTEATDASQQLYGESRLLAMMNGQAGKAAREVCEAVKADVDAFVGEAEQFDDITMLCLTWHGPKAGEVQA